MCLFLRPRIKYGAGFEDKQKSCAIWVVYLLRVTLPLSVEFQKTQFFNRLRM